MVECQKMGKRRDCLKGSVSKQENKGKNPFPEPTATERSCQHCLGSPGCRWFLPELAVVVNLAQASLATE